MLPLSKRFMRVSLYFCIINLVIMFFNPGINTSGAQTPSHYYIQIQHNSREFELTVNGIPVDEETGEYSTAIKRITHFLKNGENTLSVTWTKKHPTTLPLNIKLKTSKPGNQDTRNLIDYDYTEEEKLNRKYRKTFKITLSMPLRWTWQKGEPVTQLTEQDVQFLKNDIRKLHGYVADQNLDAMLTHLETALFDMRLRQQPKMARYEKLYQNMVNHPRFKVNPLDFNDLQAVPYGKLVKITGSKPVISSREIPNSGNIKFDDLFYAKIDNQWTLVLIN